MDATYITQTKQTGMQLLPRDQCELDAGTKERIGPGLVSTAFLGLFAALGCARVVYIGVYPPRGGGVPAVVLTAIIYALSLLAYWGFYRQCQPLTGWILLALGGAVATMLFTPNLLAAAPPCPASKPCPPNDEPQKPCPQAAAVIPALIDQISPTDPHFKNGMFLYPEVSAQVGNLAPVAWTIRSRYTMRQRGRGTWTQQCLVLWPNPVGCHLLQTITPFTVGTQYRIFVLSEDMPGQRGSLPTPSRVHLYIDGTQVQANVEKDTDFGLAILQFTASAVTHVVEIAFTNWREREMELHAVYLIPEALLGTVLGWLEGEAVAEISE